MVDGGGRLTVVQCNYMHMSTVRVTDSGVDSGRRHGWRRPGCAASNHATMAHNSVDNGRRDFVAVRVVIAVGGTAAVVI